MKEKKNLKRKTGNFLTPNVWKKAKHDKNVTKTSHNKNTRANHSEDQNLPNIKQENEEPETVSNSFVPQRAKLNAEYKSHTGSKSPFKNNGNSVNSSLEIKEEPNINANNCIDSPGIPKKFEDEECEIDSLINTQFHISDDGHPSLLYQDEFNSQQSDVTQTSFCPKIDKIYTTDQKSFESDALIPEAMKKGQHPENGDIDSSNKDTTEKKRCHICLLSFLSVDEWLLHIHSTEHQNAFKSFKENLGIPHSLEENNAKVTICKEMKQNHTKINSPIKLSEAKGCKSKLKKFTACTNGETSESYQEKLLENSSNRTIETCLEVSNSSNFLEPVPYVPLNLMKRKIIIFGKMKESKSPGHTPKDKGEDLNGSDKYDNTNLSSNNNCELPLALLPYQVRIKTPEDKPKLITMYLPYFGKSTSSSIINRCWSLPSDSFLGDCVNTIKDNVNIRFNSKTKGSHSDISVNRVIAPLRKARSLRSSLSNKSNDSKLNSSISKAGNLNPRLLIKKMNLGKIAEKKTFRVIQSKESIPIRKSPIKRVTIRDILAKKTAQAKESKKFAPSQNDIMSINALSTEENDVKISDINKRSSDKQNLKETHSSFQIDVPNKSTKSNESVPNKSTKSNESVPNKSTKSNESVPNKSTKSNESVPNKSTKSNESVPNKSTKSNESVPNKSTKSNESVPNKSTKSNESEVQVVASIIHRNNKNKRSIVTRRSCIKSPSNLDSADKILRKDTNKQKIPDDEFSFQTFKPVKNVSPLYLVESDDKMKGKSNRRCRQTNSNNVTNEILSNSNNNDECNDIPMVAAEDDAVEFNSAKKSNKRKKKKQIPKKQKKVNNTDIDIKKVNNTDIDVIKKVNNTDIDVIKKVNNADIDVIKPAIKESLRDCKDIFKDRDIQKNSLAANELTECPKREKAIKNLDEDQISIPSNKENKVQDEIKYEDNPSPQFEVDGNQLSLPNNKEDEVQDKIKHKGSPDSHFEVEKNEVSLPANNKNEIQDERKYKSSPDSHFVEEEDQLSLPANKNEVLDELKHEDSSDLHFEVKDQLSLSPNKENEIKQKGSLDPHFEIENDQLSPSSKESEIQDEEKHQSSPDVHFEVGQQLSLPVNQESKIWDEIKHEDSTGTQLEIERDSLSSNLENEAHKEIKHEGSPDPCFELEGDRLSSCNVQTEVHKEIKHEGSQDPHFEVERDQLSISNLENEIHKEIKHKDSSDSHFEIDGNRFSLSRNLENEIHEKINQEESPGPYFESSVCDVNEELISEDDMESLSEIQSHGVEVESDSEMDYSENEMTDYIKLLNDGLGEEAISEDLGDEDTLKEDIGTKDTEKESKIEKLIKEDKGIKNTEKEIKEDKGIKNTENEIEIEKSIKEDKGIKNTEEELEIEKLKEDNGIKNKENELEIEKPVNEDLRKENKGINNTEAELEIEKSVKKDVGKEDKGIKNTEEVKIEKSVKKDVGKEDKGIKNTEEVEIEKLVKEDKGIKNTEEELEIEKSMQENVGKEDREIKTTEEKLEIEKSMKENVGKEDKGIKNTEEELEIEKSMKENAGKEDKGIKNTKEELKIEKSMKENVGKEDKRIKNTEEELEIEKSMKENVGKEDRGIKNTEEELEIEKSMKENVGKEDKGNKNTEEELEIEKPMKENVGKEDKGIKNTEEKLEIEKSMKEYLGTEKTTQEKLRTADVNKQNSSQLNDLPKKSCTDSEISVIHKPKAESSVRLSISVSDKKNDSPKNIVVRKLVLPRKTSITKSMKNHKHSDKDCNSSTDVKLKETMLDAKDKEADPNTHEPVTDGKEQDYSKLLMELV